MTHPDALPERPGQSAPAELQGKRDMLAAAIAGGALPSVAGQADEVIARVRTIRFGQPSSDAPTIVHFHGGGFRQGAPEFCARYAADLAHASGAAVYCPAYRLAPEAPFPAALNDGMRVVRHLASQGPLILAGDSAGGAIAAALAQLCAQDGLAIAGLVLHSPWLDLGATSASYQTNAEADSLFSEASAIEAARMYLQGHPATDPLASPLLGDPALFPPTYISVGLGEVLLDDARAFHRRLTAASRSATVHEVAGMDHVAVTRGLDLPGSPAVLAATLSFLAGLR
ncbi:alpha/beta hydrolase fold domain-containing protein [Novosphingobium chloroacetimidivorans]|nr:alpha/beta hydrolase fold domain-containing protein [Novosphingobium chloroacetimidivorans]